MLENLRALSRYNSWANGRIYQACGSLPHEDFSAARPSFFGSIMATLNHGLVADMLWMGRFTGQAPAGITALDQILHREFAPLAAARHDMNTAIEDFFARPLTGLNEPFHYHTMTGGATVTPLGLTFLHLFNHATHHRGQVHDMLSATAVAPPVLDLIYFLRETN